MGKGLAGQGVDRAGSTPWESARISFPHLATLKTTRHAQLLLVSATLHRSLPPRLLESTRCCPCCSTSCPPPHPSHKNHSARLNRRHDNPSYPGWSQTPWPPHLKTNPS